MSTKTAANIMPVYIYIYIHINKFINTDTRIVQQSDTQVISRNNLGKVGMPKKDIYEKAYAY